MIRARLETAISTEQLIVVLRNIVDVAPGRERESRHVLSLRFVWCAFTLSPSDEYE